MRSSIAAALVCVTVSACGASGDGGDDQPGDDQPGDDQPGDDQPGDDQPGDDQPGDDDAPAFRVSGTATAPRGVRAKADAKIVDHVVAVTPSSWATRVVAPVAADGSFALDLAPSQPWVLVFVDSTRVGADMIAGVLGAGTLDTLTPTSAGALALGDVAVDGETATPGIGFDALVAGLGLSADSAAWLGAIDDLCLRYVNPDIDADGELDAVQGTRYLLDFHVQRNQREGDHQVTVADHVGRFLDPSATATYGGTGIYVSLPAAVDTAAGSHWMSFSGELHSGGSVYAADEPVAESALIVMGFGDMHSYGAYASPGHDMPQGEVRLGVGETTLTFTSVATGTDAELAAAEGLVMPFIRLVPAVEGCTTACTLAAVDYEWRRRDATGWSLLPVEDLHLVVPATGGFLSIRPGSETTTAGIGMTIPARTATGSIPWAAAGVHLAEIDEAAFLAITTDQLCHVGLSYDDRLGQRHFGAIGNSPGTCP
jgi:hypothetical protein